MSSAVISSLRDRLAAIKGDLSLAPTTAVGGTATTTLAAPPRATPTDSNIIAVVGDVGAAGTGVNAPGGNPSGGNPQTQVVAPQGASSRQSHLVQRPATPPPAPLVVAVPAALTVANPLVCVDGPGTAGGGVSGGAGGHPHQSRIHPNAPQPAVHAATEAINELLGATPPPPAASQRLRTSTTVTPTSRAVVWGRTGGANATAIATASPIIASPERSRRDGAAVAFHLPSADHGALRVSTTIERLSQQASHLALGPPSTASSSSVRTFERLTSHDASNENSGDVFAYLADRRHPSDSDGHRNGGSVEPPAVGSSVVVRGADGAESVAGVPREGVTLVSNDVLASLRDDTAAARQECELLRQQLRQAHADINNAAAQLDQREAAMRLLCQTIDDLSEREQQTVRFADEEKKRLLHEQRKWAVGQEEAARERERALGLQLEECAKRLQQKTDEAAEYDRRRRMLDERISDLQKQLGEQSRQHQQQMLVLQQEAMRVTAGMMMASGATAASAHSSQPRQREPSTPNSANPETGALHRQPREGTGTRTSAALHASRETAPSSSPHHSDDNPSSAAVMAQSQLRRLTRDVAAKDAVIAELKQTVADNNAAMTAYLRGEVLRSFGVSAAVVVSSSSSSSAHGRGTGGGPDASPSPPASHRVAHAAVSQAPAAAVEAATDDGHHASRRSDGASSVESNLSPR